MMNKAEFANIANAERTFWWYRGMEEILFRLLDPIAQRPSLSPSSSVKALEVGCGTGYMTTRFQQRYHWSMFPTDLQHEGLLYGLEHGVQRMAQAAVAALPFRDGHFNAVINLDVLVYIPRGDESHVIGELTRVLAPGGLMILRTAALEMLRSHHAGFTGEKQRFTRTQLLDLARRYGLKILRCTYANSFLMPVALAKFRIIEPLTGSQPSSGVQPVAPWLDRLLYSALHAEAGWLGAGHDLPIGQSLILIGEKTA